MGKNGADDLCISCECDAKSENDRIRDDVLFGFFRVTEKSPQSIWRFESNGGSRERRDDRSISAVRLLYD